MNDQKELKLNLIELREKWRKLPDYGCFWSSPDNEKGLKITPIIELGSIKASMMIEREHSGFPGIAHGGIGFSIIDGMMGWYIMSHYGRAGFTTNASIKYYAPLNVGKEYFFVVNELKNAEFDNYKVKLIGKAFNSIDASLQGKPLIEVEADFILPNRALASKVLGVEINEELKVLFPE